MAEIFGAVASDAGLVSLAIQLLESAQKPHSLCMACKAAPATVQELSHELQTMSLSLSQLERHRIEDDVDFELMARCIRTCQSKTEDTLMLVDRMDRRMRNLRGLDRLYTAFKEPETARLLEELESQECDNSCVPDLLPVWLRSSLRWA